MDSSRTSTRSTFKKATIRDVARLAGVSNSTISAFVAGRVSVCSVETAERIRKAIADLKYTPNSLTQGLRTNRTNTVGVAFDLPSRTDPGHHNSYGERVLLGVCSAADSEKYAVLYYPYYIRDQQLYHMYLDGRCDGLIFNFNLETTVGSYVAAAGLPAVILGRSPEYAGGCAVVYADEQDAVTSALQHLWDLGHRKIGFLAGPDSSWKGPHGVVGVPTFIGRERRLCFSEWMTARDAYREGLIQEGRNWQGDYGVISDAYDAWFGDQGVQPTAIACANDRLALTLLRVAAERGKRVPGELSIVGVDNITASAESRPPLTTVEIDAEAMGAQAVRSLLRVIEGEDPSECHVRMSVSRLVVRESSGPLENSKR